MVSFLIALALAARVTTSDNAAASEMRPDDQQTIECIDRLMVPPYPRIGLITVSSGTLRAVITLGESGTVKSQRFEVISDPKNLGIFQPAVERALKVSRFRPSCAGRTVSLVFRFKIATGDETW